MTAAEMAQYVAEAVNYGDPVSVTQWPEPYIPDQWEIRVKAFDKKFLITVQETR